MSPYRAVFNQNPNLECEVDGEVSEEDSEEESGDDDENEMDFDDGEVDDGEGDNTIIKCYVCRANYSTARYKNSWLACEKCSNWCCGKCSQLFDKQDEYFCTNCADTIGTTAARAIIRARQIRYRDKMSTQFNIKYNTESEDFKVGDAVSIHINKLDRICRECLVLY